MKIEDFEELELIRGNKRVVWEFLGEGQCGDYNKNDPEDTPLLRFSCFQRNSENWEELPDSSYCTNMPIDSSTAMLALGARQVLEAIQDVDYKRKLQELSWMSI